MRPLNRVLLPCDTKHAPYVESLRIRDLTSISPLPPQNGRPRTRRNAACLDDPSRWRSCANRGGTDCACRGAIPAPRHGCSSATNHVRSEPVIAAPPSAFSVLNTAPATIAGAAAVWAALGVPRRCDPVRCSDPTRHSSIRWHLTTWSWPCGSRLCCRVGVFCGCSSCSRRGGCPRGWGAMDCTHEP